MNELGTLDVVMVLRPKTYCVGKPRGFTSLWKVASKEGTFLLANGGFFIVASHEGMKYDLNGPPLDTKILQYSSVGPSSSNKRSVPIPQVHQEFYGKLTGDDGSYLWSGPKLDTQLDLDDPRLRYRHKDYTRTEYSYLPGGVATSSSGNERFVIATTSEGTKFLFTYTCEDRCDGTNLNQMRRIIEVFLAKYHHIDINIPGEMTQILNMDGGASIYLSWTKDGKVTTIAEGGQGGKKYLGLLGLPKPVSTPVKVAVE
ncbi:hypothetical protein P154DRAFT_608408 [Amniculicola lignicola CBS 123094]|uniref:Phosphodiester glycosidase domain-containing protein n=1 Tax=Amniculicola lignicola CBS 123094 TaxID=1392246 RepID=A0A6A5WVD4_9PLEO|nr:hypothetical protein P154DRAFT_608408 [Amniculicola lignicola CBS 123094]